METRYKVLEVLGKGTFGQVSIITLRWMRIIIVNYINCLEVNFINSVRVVEVVGFGAVWICGLMQTFWRNMLSPFSGAEVTRQGNRWLVYDVKSKGWWKGASHRDGIKEQGVASYLWPKGTWKGQFSSLLPLHTQPLPVICLKAPYWSAYRSCLPSFWVAPFLPTLLFRSCVSSLFCRLMRWELSYHFLQFSL
jgi:hypothetical protein